MPLQPQLFLSAAENRTSNCLVWFGSNAHSAASPVVGSSHRSLDAQEQSTAQHKLDRATRCDGGTADHAMATSNTVGALGLHGSVRRPLTPPLPNVPCQLMIGYCVPDSGAESGDGTAVRMSEALEQAGYTVWLGGQQLHGGQRWATELQKAVQRCDAFIPLCSVTY